jgi:ankyrin repeat protein
MPPSKKRGKAATASAAIGRQQSVGDQLVRAANKGDGAEMARLLAAGADPNAVVSVRLPSGEVYQTTALSVAAVRRGRLEAVRLLLDGGADLDRAAGDGSTPLMSAAVHGQLEVLRLLLARGAAVDAADPHNGCTAFHAACCNNQAECAETLARAGCDTGLKDGDGKTGRELAEAQGHTAVVAQLRAVVADQLRAAQAVGPAPEPEKAAVVIGDRAEPADQLLEAVRKGDGAEMALLLAAGADPNASNASEVAPTISTAQYQAVAYGRLDTARLLLDAGADPDRANAYGETPLILAAGNGQLEVLRLLLDAGADPDCAASQGITPLIMAAANGHPEVLRLLLARGAAVDAADPNAGRTAFHFACYNNQAGCAEALARAGCDVSLHDRQGRTGRELAEEEGHAAVVARLRAVVAEQLRAAQAVGPAPEPELVAVFCDGGPASQLLEAARKGDAPAVARLLAVGVDPNASVPGREPSAGKVVQTTALAVAAGCGWLEAARLLLDGGADPSRANGDGGTPLMAAAGGGQLEVLRLLLERGAAVDAADPGTGCTAFHAACINNQAECVEALARAGCDVGLKTNDRPNDGRTGCELAEAQGHGAVVARLRAAQVAGAAPAPTPAAVAGDEGPVKVSNQLAHAAKQGDVAAVARLLAAGTDPNALVVGRLPSGEVAQSTALIAAASHGRLEAARLLLDADADPGRAAGGCVTPLMQAARRGQLEVLRLLLARGAAVDAAAGPGCCWGLTAFHAACASNQAACAEALVRAGCDVGLKDSSGRTGREMADEEGHGDVVERLRVVVTEQLRAAQAAGLAPAPELAAVAGDEGPAVQR